jgi:hypothetical protein
MPSGEIGKFPFWGSPAFWLKIGVDFHAYTAYAAGMRTENVVLLLKKRQGDSSLRALARTIDCSPAYLSDIYKGKRSPGPKILKFLGLVKTVQFKVQYEKAVQS